MSSAYSDKQIESYLDHISIPAKYGESPRSLDIDFLTAIHVHHISTCPYENLTLHYSLSHKILLDPQILFKKIVSDKRGRGGYCMENSILLNHVLRGLGFNAYTAGVRVRTRVNNVPQGDYLGWFHLVNIVTLSDGSRWSVDAGFGGDGPTVPLPMVHGTVIHNLGTQEVRLINDTIPQQIDRSQKLWIYQYRNTPTKDWNSFYCFPETEFLEVDFQVLNHYTSVSRDSFHLFTPLVLRFLRSSPKDDEASKIVGKIMMIKGEVKEFPGRTGRTEIVKTCRSEEERIETLNTMFDITLTDEEAFGICGTATELIYRENAARA